MFMRDTHIYLDFEQLLRSMPSVCVGARHLFASMPINHGLQGRLFVDDLFC